MKKRKKDSSVIMLVPESVIQKEENINRLENTLLSFIEKTAKEPITEKSITVLPLLAHELIELWKIN